MSAIWKTTDGPKWAKLRDGAILRLSSMLPAFDEETQGLRDLELPARVAAGWFEVTSATAPNIDGNGDALPTVYDVASTDTGAGTVTLDKAA